MSLIWLAVKNVRHSARSYAAFFLSSTASVWMFYLYGSLLFNSEVRQSLSRIPDMWNRTRAILIAVEVLLALFSLFFIRYSQTAFIRSRQAELATLGLLGMKPRQVRRTLVWQSLIMGTGAVALGMALGALFSRLFHLMAAQVLPMEPPGLSFSWQTALLVLPTYLAIFAVTGWLESRRIVRRPVADVLREAVSPKAPPRLSVWRVLLCVATLGSAYAVAAYGLATGIEGDPGYLVMLLLVPGLYLLFTQASVALLGALRRRPRLFWHSTSLFVISQMLFKVRDNALVLFMVSTLATIAVTGLGWAYTGFGMSDNRAETALKADVIMTSSPGGVGPERLEAIFAEHGVGVRARFQLPTLRVVTRLASADGVVYAEGHLRVMPAGAFNEWRAFQGLAPLAVPDGQAAHLTPVPGPDTVGTQLQLVPDGAGEAVPFPTFRVTEGAFGEFEAEALVLSDQTYAALLQRFDQTTTYVWMLIDWRRSGPAVAQARREMQAAAGLGDHFLSRVDLWNSFRHGYALMLFLVGFVGVLFVLATGNMLYFKLFTDIDADRRQLVTLHKLGLGARDISRIPTIQAAVMFGVPVVLAMIHAVIFIPLVDVKVGKQMGVEAVAVVGGFFALLYGIYFLITRQSYLNSLWGGWAHKGEWV